MRVIPRTTALLLAAGLLLASCASHRGVFHSFDCRPLSDSPDVKVLDWSYGAYRALAWEVQQAAAGTRGVGGVSVTGRMPVPESIEVRWQVPPHPAVHQASIPLAGRLPWSMDDKEVVLMFRSGQPHVYLVTREPRPCRGPECTAHLSSDAQTYARSYLHGVIRQLHPPAAQASR